MPQYGQCLVILIFQEPPNIPNLHQRLQTEYMPTSAQKSPKKIPTRSSIFTEPLEKLPLPNSQLQNGHFSDIKILEATKRTINQGESNGFTKAVHYQNPAYH